MKKVATIEHDGVVSKVIDNVVFVELLVQSACASCHAKAVCGIDSAQKTIEVSTKNISFSVGEQVKVVLKESLGMKALFLGYLLPFIIVLTTLLIMLEFGISQGITGVISIAILAPYYFILYLFRNRIKREFNFDIEKI